MLRTNLYKKYGNFKTETGYKFIVYAPGVDNVWIKINNKKIPMNKDSYNTWDIEIEGIEDHTPYHILIEKNDEIQKKSDPFARYLKIEYNSIYDSEEPTSYTYNSSYKIKSKKKFNKRTEDSFILEVFLQRVEGKTFQEKAESILYRIKELELPFTHVQLMPVNSHSLEKSLGYKTSSPFSINYKFGTPDDFKEMVDIFHENNIGVLLDFVILEFEEYVKFGLHRYSFQDVFERKDFKQHDIFTGYLFDIHKPFVKEYLLSAMNLFVKEYKIDGFRLDGINELIFNDQRVNITYDPKNLLEVREFFSYLEYPFIILENISMITNEVLQIPNIDGIENSMAMYDIRNILQTPPHDRVAFRLKKEFSDKKYFDSKDYPISSFNHDLFITGAHDSLYKPFGEMAGRDDRHKIKALKLALKAIYSNKHNKMMYFEFDHTPDKEVEKDFIEYAKLFNNIIGNQSNVIRQTKKYITGTIAYEYTLKNDDKFIFLFNILEDETLFSIGPNIYENFDVIYSSSPELIFEGNGIHIKGLDCVVLKMK